MNGNDFLLDTNAIIQFLKGNLDLSHLLSDANHISISVIGTMEYLSFPRMDAESLAIFHVFKSRVQVYGVPPDDEIFNSYVVEARKRFKMKLPDAIIAATARINELTILTADDHFKPLVAPWSVKFYTPN